MDIERFNVSGFSYPQLQLGWRKRFGRYETITNNERTKEMVLLSGLVLVGYESSTILPLYIYDDG